MTDSPWDLQPLPALEGEAAIRSGWRELERRLTGMDRSDRPTARRVPRSGRAGRRVADPDLSTLVVGLGGRQAGLGRTAAFRLLPVTDADADELIDFYESVTTELDGFLGSALLDR